ncbi:MAG: hypothetical protein O3B84_01535 [Chloroflexi bacterium]|nr:hypothetical protein [Chloroflexota bacterium]
MRINQPAVPQRRRPASIGLRWIARIRSFLSEVVFGQGVGTLDRRDVEAHYCSTGG